MKLFGHHVVLLAAVFIIPGALVLADDPVPAPAAIEPAAVTPGGNLLQNPSFEIPKGDGYWWNQNNWPKPANDVEFTQDTDNPHSGSVSQRITLRHIVSQADLQLQSQTLALHPGMSLQLRFWTRGLPNTRPIGVALRQRGAPYTNYFQANISLAKDWTESVFNITLPPNADTKSIVLLFDLYEENTYWLDDVSLTELPPQEGGQPLVGNQIRNGSFEIGRDHWYATFRESGFNHVNDADEANGAANIVSQPADDAPAGRNVLSYQVFNGCVCDLTSAYFHLRYGYPVSVRFWLKSPANGKKFTVNLAQGKFPNQTFEGQTFTIPNKNWNFYQMTATPLPSNTDASYLEFATRTPAPYAIDGVSVVEGTATDAVFPNDRTEVGWNVPDGTPPGNLFHQSDAVSFQLAVAAPPGPSSISLKLKLVDFRENVRKDWAVSVPLDAQGLGRVNIALPSDRLGGFKVSAFLGSDEAGKIPDADLLYSILPHLKPLAEAPADSFFGGHVNMTPYNLAIAQQIGMRWLRMHPPLSTKWSVVEPTKGVFQFYTAGVARAHDMGFHVLGMFDTTPKFYADAPPKNLNSSDWHAYFYPPADWAAWETYVQKTATAFAPYVQAWEIWNEPSGQFLQLKPGQDNATVYVGIVQHTREAIESAGIPAFLVGNAASTLDRPFTWNELAQGGGKEIDALSFHLYNEDRGPEEKQPPLDPQLQKMRSYPNRTGGTPDIWDTESGIWLAEARSWLGSAQIPSNQPNTVADAANSVARMLIGSKALGLHRFFFYCSYAQPSGRIVDRDDCAGMIDTSGVPNPSGAAYAAAVYFLEDAQPVGLDVVAAGDGHVTVAKFKEGAKSINVLWSRNGIKLNQVTAVNWQKAAAFDIMGNPITLTGDTPVTLDPIYLQSTD